MGPIANRILKFPLLSLEILLVSLVINVAALGSSVFVMLVLSRYIGFGIDATLYTLIGGVLIAIAAEFGFRIIRLKFAQAFATGLIRDVAAGAFGILWFGKLTDLQNQGSDHRQIQTDIDKAEAAYNGPNLCLLVDVPFGVLFVIVLYALNPTLSLITLGFIVLAVVTRLAFTQLSKRNGLRGNAPHQRLAAHASALQNAPETARSFDPQSTLYSDWQKTSRQFRRFRLRAQSLQGSLETFMGSLQALLSVAVMSAGAFLVVQGTLDISMLIGANMLAVRALMPISRASSLLSTLNEGRVALSRLRQLATVETETDKSLNRTIGSVGITIKDMSFAHGARHLFDGINLEIKPGSILLVTGENGAGKSSFAKLLMGLFEPTSGQILVDDLALTQLPKRQWREKIAYVPQDVEFFDLSIRENMAIANPEATEAEILAALKTSDLQRHLDRTELGLDEALHRQGANLAIGQRKRLALARALMGNKSIAIFDEPTEGLDQKGCLAVYQALNAMNNAGCTVVVISSDPQIQKAATQRLNLDDRRATSQNSAEGEA
jgi:ATP-binding cassette subfamily C protein LapB